MCRKRLIDKLVLECEDEMLNLTETVSIDDKEVTCKGNAIVSVEGNNYNIHFWYMSKDKGISIMKNSDLNEKIGLL